MPYNLDTINGPGAQEQLDAVRKRLDAERERRCELAIAELGRVADKTGFVRTADLRAAAGGTPVVSNSQWDGIGDAFTKALLQGKSCK